MRRPTMARVASAALLAILCVVLILFGRRVYFQTYHADDVMREFGFVLADAYPRIDGEARSYVALGQVVPDGIMGQAGFENGAILLDYPNGWRFTSFLRQLYSHRGERIDVRVVASDDGPPLKEREVRIVQLAIPSERTY